MNITVQAFSKVWFSVKRESNFISLYSALGHYGPLVFYISSLFFVILIGLKQLLLEKKFFLKLNLGLLRMNITVQAFSKVWFSVKRESNFISLYSALLLFYVKCCFISVPIWAGICCLGTNLVPV